MSAATKTATIALDSVCKAAVELARAAAIEEAEDAALVGEHLSVIPTDERVAEHHFAYAGRAYRGWEWVVELTRVARAKTATVNDVVLLPGPDALVAPEHLAWSERLAPGDLGPGDVHPTPEGDHRLILRIQESAPLPEQLEDRDILIEQGIGRARALSPQGRLETAERWYESDRGPRSPIAEQAPASCRTCGFNVTLVGNLGLVFGVCTNVLSQEDGKVVSYDHGCGGHSEVIVASPQLWDAPVAPMEYEPVDLASITEPVVTEPVVTEPVVTEPVVAEPVVAEVVAEATPETH